MSESLLSGGEEPQSDFESQFRRVLEATGCETQTGLAAVLEIRQSSVSAARRRKSIPAEWLTKLFLKERISPEWVMTGKGSKWLRVGADAAAQPMRRNPRECTTEELLAELLRRAMGAMS